MESKSVELHADEGSAKSSCKYALWKICAQILKNYFNQRSWFPFLPCTSQYTLVYNDHMALLTLRLTDIIGIVKFRNYLNRKCNHSGVAQTTHVMPEMKRWNTDWKGNHCQHWWCLLVLISIISKTSLSEERSSGVLLMQYWPQHRMGSQGLSAHTHGDGKETKQHAGKHKQKAEGTGSIVVAVGIPVPILRGWCSRSTGSEMTAAHQRLAVARAWLREHQGQPNKESRKGSSFSCWTRRRGLLTEHPPLASPCGPVSAHPTATLVQRFTVPKANVPANTVTAASPSISQPWKSHMFSWLRLMAQNCEPTQQTKIFTSQKKKWSRILEWQANNVTLGLSEALVKKLFSRLSGTAKRFLRSLCGPRDHPQLSKISSYSDQRMTCEGVLGSPYYPFHNCAAASFSRFWFWTTWKTNQYL